MPETSFTSEKSLPHAAQQPSGISTTRTVSTDQPGKPNSPFSAEDKYVLYAALQDLANEIRRIDHERKKHQ
jgi:hypothetical protein